MWDGRKVRVIDFSSWQRFPFDANHYVCTICNFSLLYIFTISTIYCLIMYSVSFLRYFFVIVMLEVRIIPDNSALFFPFHFYRKCMYIHMYIHLQRYFLLLSHQSAIFFYFLFLFATSSENISLNSSSCKDDHLKTVQSSEELFYKSSETI